MIREPVADWAAARSDKWRRQLAWLEEMLAPIDERLINALALTEPVRIADMRPREPQRTVAGAASKR